MNPLSDVDFLPVITCAGARELVGFADLSRPDLVAVESGRSDVNDALRQLAIGLLQTACPPASTAAWRRWFRAPPGRAELQAAFAPFEPAFQVDGDGARFMQDHDLRVTDDNAAPIGMLYIDEPAGNTLDNNADHFVKRGRIGALCPRCAVAALVTLQLNGPAGGRGYRTGVRGGGPVTTTVEPARAPDGVPSLWHSLWLNALPVAAHHALGGDPTRRDLWFTFPWMAPIDRLQGEGGKLTPSDAHPCLALWATPRRIRLDFDDVRSGRCDTCGMDSDRLLVRYGEVSQGLNLKDGWVHPLTPYYGKAGEMLPVHASRSGIGWRTWLGWTLGQGEAAGLNVRPAAAVSHAIAGEATWADGTTVELRLRACGYDMDSAKPRCWYDGAMPLHHLERWSTPGRERLKGEVAGWMEAATLAASILRGAVGKAWFRRGIQGDIGVVAAALWARSEQGFHELLRARIALGEVADASARDELAMRWLKSLQRLSKTLFDENVALGQLLGSRPEFQQRARSELLRSLNGKAMRNALRLPESSAVDEATH